MFPLKRGNDMFTYTGLILLKSDFKASSVDDIATWMEINRGIVNGTLMERRMA